MAISLVLLLAAPPQVSLPPLASVLPSWASLLDGYLFWEASSNDKIIYVIIYGSDKLIDYQIILKNIPSLMEGSRILQS